MICGVVLTSISGFGVCTVCRGVCDCGRTHHGTQYTFVGEKNFEELKVLYTKTNSGF